MKLKLLLFILLLPFIAFGASTNKVDNLWVPTSARFSFGTPNAGEVLTAVDSAGFATWLPAASAGGDVFTMSNNTFVVSRTNTFNGEVLTSNLNVRGNTILGSTFGNTVAFNGGTASINSSLNFAGNALIISNANGFIGLGKYPVYHLDMERDINAPLVFNMRNLNAGTLAYAGIQVRNHDPVSIIDIIVPSSTWAVIPRYANAGLFQFSSTNSRPMYFNHPGSSQGSYVFDINQVPQFTITNNLVVVSSNLFVGRDLFLPTGSTSNFVWTSVDTTTGKGAWQAASGGGGGGNVFLSGTNVFTTTGAPSVVVTNAGQSVIFGNLIITGSIISNKNTGAHIIIE